MIRKNSKAKLQLSVVVMFLLFLLCVSYLLVFKPQGMFGKNMLVKVDALEKKIDSFQSDKSIIYQHAKWWRIHKFRVDPKSNMPLWGSYRPGIYFGMKMRTFPFSLCTGILWNSGSFHPRNSLRHNANQGELKHFTWLINDGKTFGIENIMDTDNNLVMNATYLVSPSPTNKDIVNTEVKTIIPCWIQTISIDAIHTKQLRKEDGIKSLFFYFGFEGAEITLDNNIFYSHNSDALKMIPHKCDDDNHVKCLSIIGKSDLSGYFVMQIRMRPQIDEVNQYHDENEDIDEYFLTYAGLSKVDANRGISRLKDDAATSAFANRQRVGQTINIVDKNGNLKNIQDAEASFVVVEAKSLSKSFVLDIIYFDHLNADGLHQLEDAIVKNEFQRIISVSQINDWITQKKEAYEQKFRDVFQLHTKLKPVTGDDTGTSKDDYSDVPMFTDDDIRAAQSCLSSLVGGIGFFYGQPIVGDGIEVNWNGQLTNQQNAVQYMSDRDPISLLTATPSRTAFPRGFLWDEGFHQLLISQWDIDITIQCLSDWLSAQYVHELETSCTDDDSCDEMVDNVFGFHSHGGWIPREMVLGEDGRSRVPAEFITQQTNVANPPSLLLVVDSLLDRLDSYTKSKDNPKAPFGAEMKVLSDEEADKLQLFFNQSYPAIESWVMWLLQSQQGPTNVPGSFRWRGRSYTEKKLVINTMASGLDDYPRAPLPSSLEYHADLCCWVILATRVMMKLNRLMIKYDETKTVVEISVTGDENAGSIDQGSARESDFNDNHISGVISTDRTVIAKSDPSEQADHDSLHLPSGKYNFEKLHNEIVSQLPRLHFSNKFGAYVDVGLYNYSSGIIRESYVRCQRPADGVMVDVPIRTEYLPRFVESPRCPADYSKFLYVVPSNDGSRGPLIKEKFASGDLSLMQIPRIGYVSVFPLLLKIEDPSSPRLESLLNILADPRMLWTPYGLRSLSTTDMFYRKSNAPGDLPYWRGPIWININYLALSALYHYGTLEGPYREYAQSLYQQLRYNVVKNVLRVFHETGDCWEHYDDKTGDGMRGHPFTGWTAVIVNIMAERY